MVDIIKDFQEVCLDKLTVTDGALLEMMANITSVAQVEMMLLGNIYGPHGFRSQTFGDHQNTMLRLSISQHGRGRADIVEIGKSVKLPTWGMGTMGEQRWDA